jgi:hypothetical protein
MSGSEDPWILEGYAAVFGAPDLEGDVIRAGAFRESLARAATVPLLLRHDPRLVAGVWRTLSEDRWGLRVTGALLPDAPAFALARRLLARGVDGLSIGFRPRAAKPRESGGRTLITVDLIEISIVDRPMQPHARLTLASANARCAA